jgi:hypothetical protein
MFDLTGLEPLTEPDPPQSLESAISEVAQSAKDLGAQYQVSDRTIQAWFGIITKAYYWLPPATFKVGNSNRTRYTPEFQRLISDFKGSGLSADDWINQVHQAHPEQYQAPDPQAQKRTLPNTYSGFRLTPEAIAPEIVEEDPRSGGSLIEDPQIYQVQPLIHLQIQTLTIHLPASNTTRLEQDTAQLQAQTIAALGSIQQAVTADFSTKLGAVLAQNTHAVAAMQNAAVIQAAETLGLATPVAATTDLD